MRRADVDATQAEVDAAQRTSAIWLKHRCTAAQEQYKATQSAITTAQARLTQAEVALEGARLYAPFDGIVAYLNINEGEYYSPQVVSSQLGWRLSGNPQPYTDGNYRSESIRSYGRFSG